MTPPEFGEDYFRENYTDYESHNPPSKLAWYERAVRQWTPGRPIRLLDIGCGLGAFAARMSRSDDVVVSASDISRYAIATNRRRIPAVEWVEAPATAVPWPPNTFDVITAFDVLEHLADPGLAIQSAQRMLKPRGTFVAVVPVYDGPTGPLIKWLDRDPTHLSRWNRSEWIELIGSHFTVLAWHGIFRYRIPCGPYLHMPTLRLRHLTPAVMIIARRTDDGAT